MPWKLANRSRPSTVHSANSTSTTTSGRTQVIGRPRTSGGLATNGEESTTDGRSRFSMARNEAAVNPVPTWPA